MMFFSAECIVLYLKGWDDGGGCDFLMVIYQQPDCAHLPSKPQQIFNLTGYVSCL